MSGPPPKVPRETLVALVRERRAQGKTWKEIAREIGHYHPVYLARISATYCAGAIARKPKSALKESRDGAPSADIPAASGSDTGRLP